jgi:hypothetical protein
MGAQIKEFAIRNEAWVVARSKGKQKVMEAST